jgi:DNA-binding IclR family transcriptional regulator
MATEAKQMSSAPTERVEANVSQGALRSARVLEALAERDWSLSALARHLSVERRTLGRVVSGLERERFVSRNRAGLLTSGPRYVSAARAVARKHGIVALADSVVADLCRTTGCTSMLHLPHGDYLLPEVVHTPPDEIAITFPPGRSIELWRGIGRALLQHSTANEINRLDAIFPNGNLHDVLERERELGYALSRGELVPNVIAIGAPVCEDDSPVGVLAVVGLDPDLPERCGQVLTGSARRLTNLLTTPTSA